MKKPVYTTRFRKDLKRMLSRGADAESMKAVMEDLIEGKPLAMKHRENFLTGNFRDRRECHIAPDWLLIYQLDAELT